MMLTEETAQKLQYLEAFLHTLGRCTVAVSGGIDSMLLAWIANNCLGESALIVHATSPAVSRNDGERVRKYASRCNWHYKEIVSQALQSEHYQSNPLNRCYYCKSSLYINLGDLQHGQVITGTNLDDLSDFRPGLIAAQEQEVRHPYTECQINKAEIRQIACYFQLTDLQDLPASPCLSSRIETGIRINPEQLTLIDRVESYVNQHLPGETIRLRIRKEGMVLELAAEVLNRLDPVLKARLSRCITDMAQQSGLSAPLYLRAYQRGSAFVGNKTGMEF